MIQSTNKIVVPLDFSEQSLIALDQTYNLAREYNAEMTLHVIKKDGMLLKFLKH